jgi:small conductance mechanosensitive channel
MPDFEALFRAVQGKLADWVTALVGMLPNLLLALVLLVAGWVVSRWAHSGVRRVAYRLTRNDPISNLLGASSRAAVLGLVALWALGLLGLDRTVTTLLAGVGVVGLALGFAFQDIAANFMSGFIMALSRPFRAGDLVKLAGHQGRVRHLEFRATELETLDGLTVLIPNKEVFQNAIINLTRTPCRRMDLEIGTAYGDDMEKVRSVAVDAVQDVPHRDRERAVEFFFTRFGDSSIDFEVRIWLDEAHELAYLEARSEAMIAIKKAFDRAGITIPFPIRTLDFGADAVGGTRADALELRLAPRK